MTLELSIREHCRGILPPIEDWGIPCPHALLPVPAENCKVSENSKLSHDDWVTVVASDGVMRKYSNKERIR